ncbi:baculoviral IAP repeat-containing protein 3-like [Diabrotica virgifera virgifera]|uniref:Baculoviral IAP repeat-containing protein 3-like n=1 Tax=Diabrotica virgifera virgifera TaxID=50390 RepID=A0A6P7GXV8_DIAVI|nr:baculoviral IAP repeat-containing protein 3-like [Diabrotica virgifera virgifera]
MNPSYLEYPLIVQRLKSFDEWIPTHPIKPIVLAVAGFYYTGKNDKVLCAICGVVVNKWSVCDIPLYKHKECCLFLAAYKKAQKLLAVDERLKTFPPRYKTAKKLASCGFYYTKEEGLRYITNKDITTYIARLDTFLQQPGPSKPLRLASIKRAAEFGYIQTYVGSDSRVIKADICLIIDVTVKEDIAVNNEVIQNGRLICKICFNNEINTVSLPCGHAAKCLDCSAVVQESCCICRAPIVFTTRLYI